MTGQHRMGNFLREYGSAIGLTALLLALSIWMHLRFDWSPIVLNEDAWVKKLEFHRSWAPFAIRYVQDYTTLALHKGLNLPVRESFFIIQFTLTLILGPLFYRFLRLMGYARIWSLIGLGLLMTAYPILGAYFAPTHTWDDIWSYLFLVLSLTAVLQKRTLAAGVYIALGCFAREQTIFFLPVLFVAFHRSEPCDRLWRIWTALLTAPVTYGLFRYFVWHPINPKRWTLISFNFENIGRADDTLVSTLIAFGIMWLLAPVGTLAVKRYISPAARRMLLWGLATAWPLTVAVTLCCTLARETRIFFPPFVVVIPLSIAALAAAWDFTDRRRLRWVWAVAPLLATPAIMLGIDLSWSLFAAWDYAANHAFRRNLAGVHIGLTILYVVMVALAFVWKKVRKTNRQPSGTQGQRTEATAVRT